MVDFEVATGAILTGGVSRHGPTVQDCGPALAECTVYSVYTETMKSV